MKLDSQFRLWLKCVGIFVVIGAAAWGIWDNPMFTVAPQEPGPFWDYQPEILGTFVFLYFFPALLAVAIDSVGNPFFVTLSLLEPSASAFSVLGFLSAVIALPLMYGSIVYGILRGFTWINGRLHK